ncbi:MAG: HAD-IA family hydrolase [Candidatus Saccharibacteria bacterium]|nr:HAD-IA family hydrolase [Candidatus Saccharibacteria bacterium]
MIFDCFGVLVGRDGVDVSLASLIRERLRGRVKLGVLSNMSSNQVPELVGEELAACFDQIVVSGELGVAKPDMRAYLLAAQRLGEFPDDCLLIDDSPRNVAAAEAVGMAAIQYRDADDLRQRLVEYGIITS